jgi:uncharacterized protein YigA (DUF484 family)
MRQSEILSQVLQPLFKKIDSLETALTASIVAQAETQQHLQHFLEQLQITLNDRSNAPTPNESLQRSMAKLQQLNSSRPPNKPNF